MSRRALDEITSQAESKLRGLSPSAVGRRSSFQKDLGRAELQLRAARALAN